VNIPHIPGVGSLPVLLAYHINVMCDRHEAAWRAGRRPRIEDFVTLEDEPGRTVLLREMLAAELATRRQLGETPVRTEYADCFPGDAGLIDAVFAEGEPTRDHLTAPRRTQPGAVGTGPRDGADRGIPDASGDDSSHVTVPG
jgi:hypothetical protein